MISQVQVRHVEQRARRAINRRLGCTAGQAVISVERDGNSVLLHVNSGGNAIACEGALRDAGYRVEVGPAVSYGVMLRVLPAIAEVTH